MKSLYILAIVSSIFFGFLGAKNSEFYDEKIDSSILKEVSPSIEKTDNLSFQEKLNSIFVTKTVQKISTTIEPYQMSMDVFESSIKNAKSKEFVTNEFEQIFNYESLFTIDNDSIRNKYLSLRLQLNPSVFENFNLLIENDFSQKDWEKIGSILKKINDRGFVTYYEIKNFEHLYLYQTIFEKLDELGLKAIYFNPKGVNYVQLTNATQKIREHFKGKILFNVNRLNNYQLDEEHISYLLDNPIDMYVGEESKLQKIKHFIAYELIGNKRIVSQIQQKYQTAYLEPIIFSTSHKSFTNGELDWLIKSFYEQSIVLMKNGGMMPIHISSRKVYVNDDSESNYDVFDEMLNRHHDVSLETTKMLTKEDYLFVRYDLNKDAPKKIVSRIEQVYSILPAKSILILFGNRELVDLTKIRDYFNAIFFVGDNNVWSQDRVAQMMVGSIAIKGDFQLKTHCFNLGATEKIKSLNKLKFSQPEEVNLSPKKLSQIDSISKVSIQKGAYPGSQVLVAYDGKIIYYKNFGKTTYDDNARVVDNHTYYDIASVTKIAASTGAMMKLETDGLFDLNKTVEQYLPETAFSSKIASLSLKEIMAHQAGLVSFIPFYKKAMHDGNLKESIFNSEKTTEYNLQVSNNIWIKSSYRDTIFRQILKSPLGEKKYLYSDLAYYFTQRILESQTNLSQDVYLRKNIYDALGVKSMVYNPLKKFNKQAIAPTEKDYYFRKHLVHGFVHDPGAAMMGGVAGHAGIFANSFDLATVMQMYLNEGNYAGKQIIRPEVIQKYTKSQFPGNRRGAGFDRPTPSKNGQTCSLVSDKSYGHSGFTGTFVWADPEYKINYVFLSNRVNPSAENWKIRDLNIRTEIQRIIYESILKK